MRGKAVGFLLQAVSQGITPAYAGKRSSMTLYVPIGTGSPPRMRGKEDEETVPYGYLGITPAYAGKSPR